MTDYFEIMCDIGKIFDDWNRTSYLSAKEAFDLIKYIIVMEEKDDRPSN